MKRAPQCCHISSSISGIHRVFTEPDAKTGACTLTPQIEGPVPCTTNDNAPAMFCPYGTTYMDTHGEMQTAQ